MNTDICKDLFSLLNKKGSENEDGEPQVQLRKKHRRLYIGAVAIIAAITLTLALLPDASSKSGGSITAVTTLVSGQAENGEIKSVFRGSGTLTDEAAKEVTILDSVEVLSYTVKNGDYVEKGDVLAKVDRNSALKAAAELQSAIDELDSIIKAAASDSIASTLTAGAAGRVKAVYAASGEEVADIMYEHDALMLISLDGLMAVDLNCEDSYSIGDSLTVTLADGTERSGKVAQSGNGVMTVTLSDEKGELDETVTVSDLEGNKLGAGKLYVHSALKVTGFSGAVRAVYVSEGSKVSKGQGLLSLGETEYSGRYQSLIEQREEYSNELEKLAAAYSQGYIFAEDDGIVSGISSNAKYSSLAANGAQGGISLLTCITVTAEGEYALLPADPVAPTDPTEPVEPVEPTEPADPTDPVDPVDPADPADPVDPTDPISGKYVGKVTAVSYGQLGIIINPVSTDIDGSALATVDESLLTQSVQYSPGDGTQVYVYENGAAQSGSLSDIRAGDYVLLTIENDVLVRIDCVHNQSSNVPGQGGTEAPSGGQTGGMYGSGGGSALPQASDEPEYTLSTMVVCSIIPSGTMTIKISVDELDVLSLSVGQEATVTLDAVGGQSFAGEVTAIDPIGANEGGGTKYSVTLTIDRTGLMLGGMNASAQITVAVAENVLFVPELAVFEDGNKSFVYTGYDKKTDTLTNPVEVTTGVSDGTNVQILSGIEQGTTVYYKYANRLMYSWS